MTDLELKQISNHVSNIPAVASMYIPALLKAVSELRKERDDARRALNNILYVTKEALDSPEIIMHFCRKGGATGDVLDEDGDQGVSTND
jgi:hypothetical protein